MKNAVCLLADNTTLLGGLLPVLEQCGLTVWTACGTDGYMADSRAAQTLCVVIDMAGLDGIEELEELRRRGLREPAILIADRALPLVRVAQTHVLDVLRKPVPRRDLLSWIECVCAANLVLASRGVIARRLAHAA
jgi:FixJ family two-component response regulator